MQIPIYLCKPSEYLQEYYMYSEVTEGMQEVLLWAIQLL